MPCHAMDLTATGGVVLTCRACRFAITPARLGGNTASVLQGLEAYRGPYWHQNCCANPQPCAEVLLQAGEGAGGRGQRCSSLVQDSAGSAAGTACAAYYCLLAACGRRASTLLSSVPCCVEACCLKHIIWWGSLLGIALLILFTHLHILGCRPGRPEHPPSAPQAQALAPVSAQGVWAH